MSLSSSNRSFVHRLTTVMALLLALSGAALPDRASAAAHSTAAPRPAMRELVDLHNDWRRESSADTPALTWDADLARSARKWSERLARNQRLEHESPLPDDVFGENLAWGDDAKAAAGLWYAEKAYFTRVVESGKECTPADLTMDEYAQCGHYANAVDPRFTRLGCGMAGSYLTCRYR